MCFTFGTRNCDISMWQWLKYVASKNKSSKVNFTNHDAFLPHTPKHFQMVSFEIILPRAIMMSILLSRYLNASLIKAKIQRNPYFLSADITTFCDSEPKVILIKQTSRLEITQRITLIIAFGTLRPERKSFVRVHKLLCHVNLTNIVHNDFSNHGE